MNKTKINSRGGFTLIELLIVIAIIGILASIVLVSLSSARTKAKQASAISSAKSIMSLAQVDSIATGDYSAYIQGGPGCPVISGGWMDSEASCDACYGNTFNPASVRAACKSIIRTVGPYWSNSWNNFNPIFPKFSILLPLGGIGLQGKHYCIGSNSGASLAIESESGCGWTSTNWDCSGCPGDTTAQGN